jgi:RNA polymerase sigma-70 factor (ECF subfamily)
MASDDDETRLAGLMRAALNGDETAYAAFLRAAATLVRSSTARRVRGNAAIAVEDIVQETLLAIHLKRDTWRSTEPILPWLFTIARYKAIDAFRRRGMRIELPVEDFAESLAAPETSASFEDTQHIEHAVGSLSGGQQTVVRAIALEGRTIAETASALHMKETAVRVAFHRGLSTLAQKFGRQT